jgi:polar amino acid transport system permease protein
MKSVSEKAPEPNLEIPAVVSRPKHVGWWVSAGLVALVVVLVAESLASNPQMEWDVVARYFLDPYILEGLLHTLFLAVVSTIGSIALGVLFGFLGLSRNPVLRALSNVYVWIFRSVPTLIQILFWGNMALFVSKIQLGIPGTPLTLFSIPTNSLLTPLVASIMALVVANGAYFAEIVRSGILSVDDGYRRAAAALGLNWWQIQRKVVLPMGVRVMIPPSGNQFVTILKETTLVSVIGGGDLLNIVQTIYGNNFRTVELLIVATLWFLIVTSIAQVLQNALERRVGRGRNLPESEPTRDRAKGKVTAR